MGSIAAAVVGLYTTIFYAALGHLPGVCGFVQPRNVGPWNAKLHPSSSTSSSLQAFKWPTIPSFTSPLETIKQSSTVGERNGLDPEYPWRFEGRFIFRPSLVRTSGEVQPPSANLLSVFGYSLGGSVVLEYDVSPVGPYREYVTMGGAVGLGKVNTGEPGGIVDEKRLGVGQWGTNLYVTTQVAEDVCKQVWGVPAEVAEIDFVEEGSTLSDGAVALESSGSQGKRRFSLSGWENARILDNNDVSAKRYGNIPIFWTPTIKALWAPLMFPFGNNSKAAEDDLLPVHKLRLSASALRLKRCQRIQSEAATPGEEVPLGLALVVDNVLIEIGERIAMSKQ